MHPNAFRYAAGGMFAGILLVLCACTGNAPVRFYTLNSLSAPSSPAPAKLGTAGPVIGVGPVVLPDYLNRPQIVTRKGQNVIAISDDHHWAGELRNTFTRVLVENLSVLMPTNRIATYPWGKSVPVRYQATVNVTRFDGRLGESVTLNARWFLFNARGKTLLAKRARISEPVKGNTYTALAAAQSRALAEFSREIAEALKSLMQTGG